MLIKCEILFNVTAYKRNDCVQMVLAETLWLLIFKFIPQFEAPNQTKLSNLLTIYDDELCYVLFYKYCLMS